MRKNKWSQAEIQFVLDNRDNLSQREISKILGRSRGSISGSLSYRGLTEKRENYFKWTENEILILKQFYLKIPSSEIAIKLKRSRNAVRQKAIFLGLGKAREKVDFQEIKQLYESGMSSCEIGRKFGINSDGILRRLRRHGNQTRSRAEGIKLQYRKSGRKSAMFGRQGSKAPNWKGGISNERGYILVYNPNHPRAHRGRVREHIVVWEKHHGKRLPEGWVIHHLNGVRSDNRPENLLAMPTKKHDKLIPEMKIRIQYLEEQNEKLSQKIKEFKKPLI